MNDTPNNNPSQPKASDRRSVRNIIIHKPMQQQFTLITIAIMMFSACGVSFVIHSTLHETIADSVGRIGGIGAYTILSDVSYDLIVRVVLVFFATIIAVGLFGIFFLHRVAGPAYRFHQLFKSLSRDQIPSDVTLREKDFFKEIAVELNMVFKSLRKRQQAIEQVETIISSMSSAQLPPETKQKVEQLRSILQELKK